MPEVQLVSSGVRLQSELAYAPFQQWIFPDASPSASFWRCGQDYLVRFPALADFEISADGSRVAMWRPPSVAESTARNLFLNQAVPLALSRQGSLVLHASAVDLNGQCVAFAAPSGRGKSTLAASFARAGHAFLCDDALLVEQADARTVAMPGHPTIRLWPESEHSLLRDAPVEHAEALEYTRKARLLSSDLLPHCEAPRPLHTIFFLGEEQSAGIRLETLSGAAATVELLRHSFILDTEEPALLGPHFERIAGVARQVNCVRFDYPRRYECLHEVMRAVTDQVGDLASRQEARLRLGP
jgi:hypothetical protein